MSERLQRINGFQCPLHFQQVLSWVGYAIQIILYFTTIFPTLTKGERWICSILFLVFWVNYNICFILGTNERHVDPIMDPSEPGEKTYCHWCKKWVKVGCKHCGTCNQCRQEFDHHCFFMNNCVTSANYTCFVLGVVFLTLSCALLLCLCVWVIMSFEYDDNRPLERAKEFYGSNVPKAVIDVFCGLHMFMNIGIMVFTGYLVALHVLLHRRGISTYELIVWRRDQERRKAARVD